MQNRNCEPQPVDSRRVRQGRAPLWTLMAGAALSLSPIIPNAIATDGTFTGLAPGTWSDENNWLGAEIANGAGATAILSGTKGVEITLDQPVTLGSLLLDGFIEAGASWVFKGGTLNLDSGVADTKAVINLGNSSSFSSRIRMAIGSVITGTSGLSVNGGALQLTGTSNTFTGGIDLAGQLRVAGVGSLNNNTIRFTGNSAQLMTGTAAANYKNNLVLGADGVTINSYASGTVTTLSGVISEEGGPRDLALYQPGLNVSTFLITGNNTYTGNTNIGRGSNDTYALVVRAESDNAFGMGTAYVNIVGGTKKNATNDAVWLGGNVKISDKTLVLRGKGYQDGGSLKNNTGNNEWAGNIELGEVADARIGVNGNTSLIVSGVISGESVGGLTKSGIGRLILMGDNTHSTGTTAIAGTIVAGHDNAFGGAEGDFTLEGTAILEIATGVNLQVNNLSLDADSSFVFDLSGSANTRLTVHGDQTGSGNYLVNIITSGEPIGPGVYTLMSFAGEVDATGFTLGEHPLGTEDRFLQWNGLTKTLTYTVVPEPGTYALFSMVLLGGALGWKRKKRESGSTSTGSSHRDAQV